MTKLIGTGKDPRAPKGVDYDIPDVREEEVRAHVEGGIGEVVDLPEEMDRIHRSERIIVAEGGDEVTAGPDHGAGRTAAGEHEDNTAARIESTAPEGDRAARDAGVEGDDSGSSGDGLSGLKRAQLNERAEAAGVENPSDLPNREAVIDAIRDAEGGSGD